MNYISDAVSDRVIKDINDINASMYDLQENSSDAGHQGLDDLITDMNIPAFFQYCVNKGFIIDTTDTMLQCIRFYMEYINTLMLDELLPNYDPEEDLS